MLPRQVNQITIAQLKANAVLDTQVKTFPAVVTKNFMIASFIIFGFSTQPERQIRTGIDYKLGTFANADFIRT